MQFKPQKRILGGFLGRGLLLLGLLWPNLGHAQEIFQSTDKFSGTVHYSTHLREADLEGGSFFTNRTARFNFNAYRPGTAESPYSLGVQTLTGEWVFIRAGASLDFKIDGANVLHLTGNGSSGSRAVITGSLVREDAFYDLSLEQLNALAHAKSVEFRIYGDHQIITGSLPAAFQKDASIFAARIPASTDAPITGLAGSPAPLTLGVHFVELTPTAMTALHMTDDHGLIIYTVDPGSRAEKIGLKKADVILSINNVPTKVGGDVPKGIAAVGPANKIIFRVWRGGIVMDLQSDPIPTPP